MVGSNNSSFPQKPALDGGPTDDEGGLRAPPGLKGWRKAWWWFDFIILVKLARLRFIGILAVIGVVITQWDTLVAYYDKWTRPAGTAASAGADVEYFCPMHPSIIRDNPKEKCPICFMPLSKRKKTDGHIDALPAGVVNRVQLSPYRIVLAGVQTWKVDFVPLTKKISAVGYVEFNERGQRTVSARVMGRIDKLFANETGKMITAGDPLVSLYSPELVVTVQNLVDAKRDGSQSYLSGARTRLERLGIDDAQISEILAVDSTNTHLTVRSPITGHIINKYVREGQYVQEGTPLYDMADLSTVWIQAQVYEDDLAFLPLGADHAAESTELDGLEISATMRAFPDEAFHGKLAFIYPHVDQDTRTVSVRCEVDNPHPHKLRPGATATVTLTIAPQDVSALSSLENDAKQREMLQQGSVLAVPEGSVIDTGSQKIVYKEASPGVYEGVEVALGPAMSNPDGAVFYPVLRGLAQGESVVTSGSFLIDAETRLNPAAGSIYFGGSSGSQANRTSTMTVRPSTPEDPDAKITAALAQLSDADRKLVETQQFCPVLPDNRLGSMGTPVKVMLDGQPVFVCCSGCTKSALANPAATLKKVESRQHDHAAPTETLGDSAAEAESQESEITVALASLPERDQTVATAQRYCAVLNKNRLGSMGAPVKVVVQGQPVFLCCEGCKTKALANPRATLARAKELTNAKVSK